MPVRDWLDRLFALCLAHQSTYSPGKKKKKKKKKIEIKYYSHFIIVLHPLPYVCHTRMMTSILFPSSNPLIFTPVTFLSLYSIFLWRLRILWMHENVVFSWSLHPKKNIMYTACRNYYSKLPSWIFGKHELLFKLTYEKEKKTKTHKYLF